MRWFLASIGCAITMVCVQPIPTRAQVPFDDDAAGVAEDLGILRHRWISAYEAGDADGMRDLYVEDAVRMPYDAPSSEGRRAILTAYRRQFRTRTLFPTIRLLPDQLIVENGTVIERGRYDEILTSRDGQMRIRERGKYVSVARLGFDGRWRYAISIFNRDGPPTTER